MSSVALSIITVTYNCPEFITTCLSSLYSTLRVDSFEIIVVDNASHDNTVETIKREFPDVILVENAENIGYGGAINQGLERALGDYVAVLNPDTEARHDVFSDLLDIVKQIPKAGCIGCTLISSDGTPQRSFFNFPSLIGRIAYYTGVNRLINTENIPKPSFEINGVICIEVNVVSGAFFILQRDIFKIIDGFDSNYFLYHEEADLCYRLHKAGYKNIIVPGLSLIHHGIHNETAENPIVLFHRNRSLLIYFYNHFSIFSVWMLFKMNVLFYTVRYILTFNPFSSRDKKVQTRKAINTVLQYHKKFLTFLLQRSQKEFP